jgi:hypothetical protein
MGSELKSSGKPFAISKREVWEAYEQVKANNGAPGADGVTLEAFQKDLKAQPVQDLEPDGLRQLRPAPGGRGGDTKAAW